MPICRGTGAASSSPAPMRPAPSPAIRRATSLIKLPLFAVGQRSADAARQAGFSDVTSAGGDVRDLVRLIAERRADATAPLLYLAGEDRAADLVGRAGGARHRGRDGASSIAPPAAPFPPELIAALKAGEVDAVLHFSGAAPRIISPARRKRASPNRRWRCGIICLSAQIAEPLAEPAPAAIAVAPRPR